jgi:hypothetical protein
MRALASYDSFSMKTVLALIAAALFCGALRAQAPVPAPGSPPTPADATYQNAFLPQGPVPISEEPHHRLLLQNDFVHVYTVNVPPLDATLLHQHDLPYLYVSLGPADIINAIAGKPELHQILQDGETHYSPGHFAHIARTDSGLVFRNVTVELVRPQGTAKNICKDVIAGPLGECPQPAGAQTASGRKSAQQAAADDDVPYFETDEIRVDLFKVAGGRDYVDAAPKGPALLIALTDANLDANLGGEHVAFLHGGDVLWLPAGQNRRVVDFLGTRSSFLMISFKDGAGGTAAQ